MSGAGGAKWGSARELLIGAATELLIEHFSERESTRSLTEAFGFLDAGRVAKRAGVARSAFYHHWGEPASEDDERTAFERFLDDLANREWTELFAPAVLVRAMGPAESLPDLIREMGDLETARFEDPAEMATYRAEWVITAYGRTARDAAKAGFDEMGHYYEAIIGRFGRRVRPQFSAAQLAAVVSAYLEGLLISSLSGVDLLEPRVEFDHPRASGTAEWSISSLGIEALVDLFTEPVAPSS